MLACMAPTDIYGWSIAADPAVGSTLWTQALSAPRRPVNRRHVFGFTRGRVVESFRMRIAQRHLDQLLDDVPMQSGCSQQPLGEWKRPNWWLLRIGGDVSPLIGSGLPFKHPTRSIAPHESERSSVVIDPDYFVLYHKARVDRICAPLPVLGYPVGARRSEHWD